MRDQTDDPDEARRTGKPVMVTATGYGRTFNTWFFTEGAGGDGDRAMNTERRFWYCRNGHILGEIRWVESSELNGRRGRTLMLFEHSRMRAAVTAELPKLRCKIVFSTRAICCTICGSSRDWIFGKDQLDQLVEHVLAERRKSAGNP